MKLLSSGVLVYCLVAAEAVLGQDRATLENPCIAQTLPSPIIENDTIATPLGDEEEPQELMRQVLQRMAIARRVPVLEIPIPNACAKIVKGRPVIYVNSEWLERQTGGDRFGKMLILAHELGHHVNFHDPRQDGLQPWEREAAADRFAGSVLRALGATEDEIYALVERIFPLEGSRTHPDRAIRYISLLQGYSGRWDGVRMSQAPDTQSDVINQVEEESVSEIERYTEEVEAIRSGPDGEQIKLLGAFMASAGVESLLPAELLVTGKSNQIETSPCFSRNSLPSIELWPRLIDLSKVVDVVSERTSSRMIVTSGYRSAEYNSCVGGAVLSKHIEALALDIHPVEVDVAQLFRVLCQIRSEGVFTGGIGYHDSFIHFDLSGENRNWGNADSCEQPAADDQLLQIASDLKRKIEGFEVDEIETGANYDVVLQAGHVGRLQGATGTVGKYVTEQELNLYLASNIRAYLDEAGLRVAVIGAEGFQSAAPIKTKIFISLHADAASPPCSVGPSYAVSDEDDRSGMAAVAVGLGTALSYEPNDFFADNFTERRKRYYAYRYIEAQEFKSVLEVGELTCPEQEENILRNLNSVISNLGAAIRFQVASSG